MASYAGFQKVRRIWPGEMREGHSWPRKQHMQEPAEETEQVQSLEWIRGLLQERQGSRVQGRGQGCARKHGGHSLAFPPMIWVCHIYPMVSHSLIVNLKWCSKNGVNLNNFHMTNMKLGNSLHILLCLNMFHIFG